MRNFHYLRPLVLEIQSYHRLGEKKKKEFQLQVGLVLLHLYIPVESQGCTPLISVIA